LTGNLDISSSPYTILCQNGNPVIGNSIANMNNISALGSVYMPIGE